jgi:hypothetical protein
MSAAPYVRFGLPESDQASFKAEAMAIGRLPEEERAAYSITKEMFDTGEGWAYHEGGAMRIDKGGVVLCWRRIDTGSAPYLGDDWRDGVHNA